MKISYKDLKYEQCAIIRKYEIQRGFWFNGKTVKFRM
jgi:hypothetical protein